jgi:hypothetical protein
MSKKAKNLAIGTSNADNGLCIVGDIRVTDTGRPKSSKEIDKSLKKDIKNMEINVKRIQNKYREEKLIEDKEIKREFDKMCKEKKVYVPEKLNKSKMETIRIIEQGAANGVVITVSQARMIKKENRIMDNIKTQKQAIIYFQTLEGRVGTKGMHIILMAVIWIIQAKNPMPKAARPYYDRSVALANAQTNNLQGFFSPAFSGLALLITRNGLLDTAIEAFEAKNGTGSARAVEAAVAKCKISVDLLVAYINSLCIANQTDALAIIASALMLPIKKKTTGAKPDFGIKQGATGEIQLTSLAGSFNGKRCPTTYYWQYGLMVAGVMTWYDLPETVNRCKTVATGMSLTQETFFRKRTRTTNGGLSAWSAVESILSK